MRHSDYSVMFIDHPRGEIEREYEPMGQWSVPFR